MKLKKEEQCNDCVVIVISNFLITAVFEVDSAIY